MYFFNPAVTMVRMDPEEKRTIGRVMAEKLNKALGPTEILIPLRGFSMYCHEGEPLHDPEGDQGFVESLKKHLKPEIPVTEVEAHINDPAFAQISAAVLTRMIEQSVKAGKGPTQS